MSILDHARTTTFFLHLNYTSPLVYDLERILLD